MALERLDCVLAVQKLPLEDRNTPAPSLRPVRVVDAGLQVFETTANTRLSTHFALEATLGFD